MTALVAGSSTHISSTGAKAILSIWNISSYNSSLLQGTERGSYTVRTGIDDDDDDGDLFNRDRKWDDWDATDSTGDPRVGTGTGTGTDTWGSGPESLPGSTGSPAGMGLYVSSWVDPRLRPAYYLMAVSLLALLILTIGEAV